MPCRPSASYATHSRSCGLRRRAIRGSTAPGRCCGTWRESWHAPSARCAVPIQLGGSMLKRIFILGPALLVPTLLAAQTPKVAAPNEHASDIAKAKVAANMARRATHVRGEAVGLDNRPVTPATHAVRATPATRAVPNPDGGPATRAIPATPATPAVPASPSHRPDHAGQGGQGRENNPRRP